ncbi:PD-(D/E)XK nuclease family protein [Arcobacter sp. YIC-464]|uniref:PD-(D/E)XK nuclease family protein n=1 Tax=Arcobacter sp. YIC-464 TaxID=3376631 RepID=UPI003C1E4AB8
MLEKNRLFVFPTSRAIRTFLGDLKNSNTLLPFTLTIDEFFKKSIIINDKKYCDEEQRFLFLKEAIKGIDVSKLGISDSFTKFLKQNEYIYRFFTELSSEKISIEQIKTVDTYDYYFEHLEILSKIYDNYTKLLEKNDFVDRVTYHNYYELNKNYLNKFSEINLIFEGYFTKVEFDIIKAISSVVTLNIKFFSNEYNQKSLELFKEFIEDEEIEINYEYIVNMSDKKISFKNPLKSQNQFVEIKGFNSRVNQIAFIKSSIVNCIKKGINPSNIALVLPDESFANTVQLFDNERYFNFAMGKSIENRKLYEVSNAIYDYLNEKELVNTERLNFLKIDKKFIDDNISTIYSKICTKENYEFLCDYIKTYETNNEILQKFDEVVYKLTRLLFSSSNTLLLKDVYKILLQRIKEIKLDDINSGKITVLGLLETRANNFDAVIICDFNEQFIPKASVKDKFLSSKIKSMTNLPTLSDRELLQKYYYKRLIDSSKEVYISYVNSDSNQITRFANELFSEKIDYNLYDNSYRHILYNNHTLKHYNKDIVDKIDLTKFSWSASSLKTFLECKRRFYLQYILKISDHDISLKPKSYELGNIVHEILEKYYTIDNSNLELDFRKIENLFIEYRSENPLLALDLEIWKKKLYEFYLFDSNRLQHSKILGLEKSFEIDFDGIKLKGIVDRIDYNNTTNRYEVIDYKTSASLKVDTLKNYDKSIDFQLEFYYLAVNELYKTDNIDTFYYDLNSTKLIEEIALDKKLELLSEKINELKELSKSEINFEKTEQKSACSFCIYKTICDRE